MKINGSRERRERMKCINCGHEVVLIDGDLHHGYESISWFLKIKERRLTCDFYKSDGKTMCGCDYPVSNDEPGLRGKIIREMMINSKESE